jgi:ATP-dependent Clp protease ATP-binding subunit ClpB
MVDEPSREDALAIIRGIKDKYEAHHGIKITDRAIEASVDLSIKYISDRKLPDKAIDLMDEALSSVKLKSISKPVELDILEKELRTLQIELEAKKVETPPASLSHQGTLPTQLRGTEGESIIEKLEKKIASKKEQTTSLESAWKKEKTLMEKQKEIIEKIENLKQKAFTFERE